jgi:hypothetical protein
MKTDQIKSAIERKLTEKYGGVSRKTVKQFTEEHPKACTFNSLYLFLLGHRTLTYNNIISVFEALKLEIK